MLPYGTTICHCAFIFLSLSISIPFFYLKKEEKRTVLFNLVLIIQTEWSTEWSTIPARPNLIIMLFSFLFKFFKLECVPVLKGSAGRKFMFGACVCVICFIFVHRLIF